MSSYNSNHESKKVKRKEDVTPVDTGLIRCVCPSTEDDGFTIQCERCLVWQHAYCVNITHATIPDHYLCDQCSKRKRPKLSKRIPISKTKLKKLDAEDDLSFNKKKRHVKSRIVSRYVHPIFREAKERWSRWKQHEGHLLYDHGPFVTMDTSTLLTKGVLMDTPVSNQGVFATRTIPSLRYLMQVTGDVLLKSEFKFDPVNDYVILGTPLSHIMFYPTLDLCIDTRQFGNKARYIRRSCHPNAELRNVVLPRDDKVIHLGLFARHLIEKGQEITISWSWQRGHIAWKENMNWHHQHKSKDNEGHQVIDEEEERRRKTAIKNMLDRFEKEFGACACLNKRRCLIEHLKRQIAPPPPKEKAVFKLPDINILPRRKSSIILLKPKAQVKLDATKHHKSGEESLDIDVTSNSPTLGPKEISDDELVDVDVEGDIDIGDDLPTAATTTTTTTTATTSTTKDTLPSLDDNSSDEENAELSSLSSLSSLSVFEESGNDNSDDEKNRMKIRRKKHASRHAKSRSHHYHHHHQQHPLHHTASSSSSSSVPILEKNSSAVSNTLPRKKLWMRDYFNKSVPDQLSSDAQHLRHENTYLHENYTTDPSNVNNSMEIDTRNKMRFYDSTNDRTLVDASPEDIEAAKLLLDAMAANEIPYRYHRPPPPPPPPAIVTDTIMPDFQNTITDNIDEGELSDASTILLDQDELREAYRRRSFDDDPMENDGPVINRVAGESRSDLAKETSVIRDHQVTVAVPTTPDLNTVNVDSIPNIPYAASTTIELDRMNAPDARIATENVVVSTKKDADTTSDMPSPCVSPTSTSLSSSTSVSSKSVLPPSVPLTSIIPLTNEPHTSASPMNEPRKSILHKNEPLTSISPLNGSIPIADIKLKSITMNILSTANKDIVHAPTTNEPTATNAPIMNNTMDTTLSTSPDLTEPVIEKKPIRKISLQEYLFNQQQKKMH